MEQMFHHPRYAKQHKKEIFDVFVRSGGRHEFNGKEKLNTCSVFKKKGGVSNYLAASFIFYPRRRTWKGFYDN